MIGTSTNRFLRAGAAAWSAAWALVAAGAVLALPMPPEDCARAKSEQASLAAGGAAEDMARGPEWARANLSPDRLKRVARWIELEELILFQCPRPKPAPRPETAARDGEEKRPAGGGTPPAKRTTDSGADGPKPAAAPPKPRPKPQRKPKVEDAYQPPTPLSGQDMQHAAPGLSVPAGAPALGP